jgi:hypothetical protein
MSPSSVPALRKAMSFALRNGCGSATRDAMLLQPQHTTVLFMRVHVLAMQAALNNGF